MGNILMKKVVQVFIKMIVNLIHKGDQKLYRKYFNKKSSSDFHFNSLIVGIGIVFEQAFTSSKLTIKH